jgi:dihydroorotate dehydrogenase
MMPEIPLFANICNSRITPDNEKINELKYIMEKLYPYVQAFEINISCPNQK